MIISQRCEMTATRVKWTKKENVNLVIKNLHFYRKMTWNEKKFADIFYKISTMQNIYANEELIK